MVSRGDAMFVMAVCGRNVDVDVTGVVGIAGADGENGVLCVCCCMGEATLEGGAMILV